MNRLATVHQRHRQTGETGQDRTDNGPIAYGEPFYKRSPKNLASFLTSVRWTYGTQLTSELANINMPQVTDRNLRDR